MSPKIGESCAATPTVGGGTTVGRGGPAVRWIHPSWSGTLRRLRKSIRTLYKTHPSNAGAGQ